MRIELLYEGGITTFELNTLPALLHHLAALHPDAGIRLRAVEQAAGGAMVVINVEHSNAATVEEIRTDAERSQAAQLALRDDSAARWEIEKRLLLDEVFPRMLAAAGQHVHIDGPATGLVIASGYASVTADQTINDLAPIREVLDDVMNRRMEWGLAQGQAEQLERAVRDVQSELQKSQPRHPVVSEGLKAIRDFVVGALGNAAGTALATNTWAPLLDQLARVANLLAR